VEVGLLAEIGVSGRVDQGVVGAVSVTVLQRRRGTISIAAAAENRF
jgi:hypothetical protein